MGEFQSRPGSGFLVRPNTTRHDDDEMKPLNLAQVDLTNANVKSKERERREKSDDIAISLR